MRKLLVASQKSGVGKTTTSINLAAAAALAGARVLLLEADPLSAVSSALNLSQHPQRQQLRASGVDLPGVLCLGVIPGLDVILPYEEGGCSDDDMDRVLQLLGNSAFNESHDCLVINSQPFLGGRPEQLLACCDEFIVVMQAEALAYRTMPAFLELVQRAVQSNNLKASMRGILLTFTESEQPGGRMDRELRGRFGSKVLQHVVPHDEEVARAALFGHVLVHDSPEAPAGLAYKEVAGEMQLARNIRKGAGRTLESSLTMAAAAVRSAPPAPKLVSARPAPRRSSTRIPRLPPVAPAPVGKDSPDQPMHNDPLPPVESPALERSPRPYSPSRPPSHSDVTAHRPEQPTSVPPQPANHLWVAWVLLAMAGGIGLRFLDLPSTAVPVMVGLAVTAGVVLAFYLFSSGGERHSATVAPPPQTNGRKSSPGIGRIPVNR